MKFIELEQNTDAWLDYRYDHRNASEAGTIMGVNPYQTKEALMLEKTMRHSEFKGNIVTDYGHRWEDRAREVVSKILGIELAPAIAEEGAYSASLDAYGVEGNENVKVEIKCPFQRHRSKLWAQTQIEGSWEQLIPEHYRWQIVHQEMVCPTARTYFFVFIPGKDGDEDDFSLIECFPRADQIADLRAAWDKFYDDPVEDSFVMADEYQDDRNQSRKALKESIAVLQEELKSYENELKDLAPRGKEVRFSDGTRLKWMSRKGSVNTGKIAKEFGIDLDQYRNKDTEYQQFQESK
jgi:putative phage-type endonuclease